MLNGMQLHCFVCVCAWEVGLWVCSSISFLCGVLVHAMIDSVVFVWGGECVFVVVALLFFWCHLAPYVSRKFVHWCFLTP